MPQVYDTPRTAATTLRKTNDRWRPTKLAKRVAAFLRSFAGWLDDGVPAAPRGGFDLADIHDALEAELAGFRV